MSDATCGHGKDRGSFQSVRPIHPDEPRVITVREGGASARFPGPFQVSPNRLAQLSDDREQRLADHVEGHLFAHRRTYRHSGKRFRLLRSKRFGRSADAGAAVVADVAVGGKNTTPEIRVRRAAHALGLRFQTSSQGSAGHSGFGVSEPARGAIRTRMLLAPTSGTAKPSISDNSQRILGREISDQCCKRHSNDSRTRGAGLASCRRLGVRNQGRRRARANSSKEGVE